MRYKKAPLKSHVSNSWLILMIINQFLTFNYIGSKWNLAVNTWWMFASSLIGFIGKQQTRLVNATCYILLPEWKYANIYCIAAFNWIYVDFNKNKTKNFTHFTLTYLNETFSWMLLRSCCSLCPFLMDHKFANELFCYELTTTTTTTTGFLLFI